MDNEMIVEVACEQNQNNVKNTKEDLKKNKSKEITHLHCANRDGDLYYINCPDCNCNDLKSKRILMCKSCGLHFNLYFEDGHKELLLRDSSNRTDEKLKIGTFEDDGDYFQEWYIITPSTYGIKFKKQITLYKDLGKNGKDGHNHQNYKRYALIPLGDVKDKNKKTFVES